MAPRLLLTLLALLAGLAAQFTPAQARSGAAVEVGAVATVTAGQRQSVSRLPASISRSYRQGLPDERRISVALEPALTAPSVLPGIDRAHE